MFLDQRLKEVASVLRPEVPVPVIFVTQDSVGQARVRELQGLDVDVQFASRLTPQLHGRLLPDNLEGVRKANVLEEAWYDAPQYAGAGVGLQTFFNATGPIELPRDTVVTGLDDVRAFTYSKDIYDKGATGRGVLVAVCDTGIDDQHPMLKGQVRQHLNFATDEPGDRVGHGTFCASAIAGLPTEYQGNIKQMRGRVLQGMTDKAQLLDCRVLDAKGAGSTSRVIAGIEAAVMNGARIVSLSLGSLFGGAGRTPDAQIVDEASKRGVAVCCAAGNSFGYATIGSPASAAGAVAVGSVAMRTPIPGAVSTFSSKGPLADGRVKPEIAAPGGQAALLRNAGPLNEVILGATAGEIAGQSGEPYGLLRGSSMATPVVAGILAQVAPLGLPKERNELEGMLARSGWGHAGPVLKNNRTGWGIIDARRVVNALAKPISVPTRGWVTLQTVRSRPVLGLLAGLGGRLQSLPVEPHMVRLPSYL